MFFNFRVNLTTSAFVIGVGYLATIFMITCARGKNCPYVKYSFVLGKDVVDDHALRNYVIATLTVPGAVECYNNCRLNCQCISINFRTKRKQDNCELNKENRHLKPSDLHPEPDAQYYDLVVDYNVKVIFRIDGSTYRGMFNLREPASFSCLFVCSLTKK